MEKLKKRILDISFKYKTSHLGSIFSSLDIIDDIYKKKNEDDIFILSCGHCAMALYVVLEKFYGINAEQLFLKHGVHPHLDEENKIYCSTGSLGMGLPVAIGRALADKNRIVHCLISDGECAEGSIWESLKFIYENNVKNIKVYVNINGYSAYNKIETKYLEDRLKVFLPDINIVHTKVEHYDFLKGINAHYHVIKEEEYNEVNR